MNLLYKKKLSNLGIATDLPYLQTLFTKLTTIKANNGYWISKIGLEEQPYT